MQHIDLRGCRTFRKKNYVGHILSSRLVSAILHHVRLGYFFFHKNNDGTKCLGYVTSKIWFTYLVNGCIYRYIYRRIWYIQIKKNTDIYCISVLGQLIKSIRIRRAIYRPKCLHGVMFSLPFLSRTYANRTRTFV